MAIAVRCTACGRQFRAANSRRGKTVPCTHCAAELLIDGRDVPDFDVFISYSTKDKPLTDAVVAALEASKLRCWVAPRDIAPGAEWGSSIIDGINNSRMMVLVYSGHSNASPQVLREVERAVSKGLTITPLRVDPTPMTKGMEFLISTCHWLDALTPPLDQHLARLVRQVRVLIEQDYDVPQPTASPTPPAPVPLPAPRRRRGKTAFALAIVAVLIVAGVIASDVGRSRSRLAGLWALTARLRPAAAPTTVPAARTTVPAARTTAPAAGAISPKPALAGVGAGRSRVTLFPRNPVPHVKTPADDLAALEATLDRAVRHTVVSRAPLAVGEQVLSDTTFKANAKGYALSGKTQIGNSGEKEHSAAPSVRAVVVAEPGFCLEGGSIVVSNGQLELQGTEQNPCVLIGVTIICEYEGSVRATHTLFDNCTFGKGGNFHWAVGYTSKWTFQDCVLRKSNFKRLDRITYGIDLHACAFVDCAFPQRHWGYARTESPDDDAAAMVRRPWSRIEACDFYRCAIAPSVFWCMNKCNCWTCNVKVEEAAEVFQSRTNLDVAIGLVPGAESLIADLRARTSANGTGKVNYTSVPYLPRP